MSRILITRATILDRPNRGSFALALRKYATDLHISGWDRPDTVREASSQQCNRRSLRRRSDSGTPRRDLIYIALPIGVTIDLPPRNRSHTPPSTPSSPMPADPSCATPNPQRKILATATALFVAAIPCRREVAGRGASRRRPLPQLPPTRSSTDSPDSREPQLAARSRPARLRLPQDSWKKSAPARSVSARRQHD